MSRRNDDADALFDGRLRDPASGVHRVDEFFETLREVASRQIPQTTEDRHIALIQRAGADARRLGRPNGLGVGLHAIIAPIGVKLAAVSLLILFAGGTLAATGRLPLWQDKVADAVDFVVDLPGGSDDDHVTNRSSRTSDDREDATEAAPGTTYARRDNDSDTSSGRQTSRSTGTSSIDPGDGSQHLGSQGQQVSGEDTETDEDSEDSDEETLEPEESDDEAELDDEDNSDEASTDVGPMGE